MTFQLGSLIEIPDMGNGGGRKSNSTQERPHRISIGVVGDGGAEEFIEWFDVRLKRMSLSFSNTRIYISTTTFKTGKKMP